jgi:uncharacterized protein
MPVAPTYPGVYIEEIPSGVRTITGVATSITAFVGRTVWGPENEPTPITSFADFERRFGGLAERYPLSYAVRDFYMNGGSQALIVRLFPAPKAEGQEAADAVAEAAAAAAAASGAGPEDVATAARARANEFTTEPAKSVADKVAKAAEEAADEDDATKESVKAAAASAAVAAAAVPRTKATLELASGTASGQPLVLEAASSGPWGNELRARVEVASKNDLKQVVERYGLTEDDWFNLLVHDRKTETTEMFVNVSVKDSPRRIDRVLEQESQLARVVSRGDAIPKASDADLSADAEGSDAEKAKAAKEELREPPFKSDKRSTGVADTGKAAALTHSLNLEDYLGSAADKTGINALEKADLFNLLCIPPDNRDGDVPLPVLAAAMEHCVRRRAMLIVDPRSAWAANTATAAQSARSGLSDLNLTGDFARNAALYFPRVRQVDPKRDGQVDTFVPCGIIAGIMARTDTQRGVWKAPAGLDAALVGVQALQVNLTDEENGMLNPLGINCLRFFPVAGRVVWGARTLRGADQLADEYKYVPVRRLALYIEESLYRGTQWVVFEPNDEPLWAQIRLNIGAFMHNLFRQGAFQGTTPRDAYFVKCDKETTTQNHINLGIVNIVVGFAPLKPAEFVIIQLQQMAGQIQT